MKNFTHESYTVSWNCNFYHKSFSSLEDAKKFANEVDGVVMETIWYNDTKVDRPLK